MNKEVIYIDVEDDVTAIIGKIKTTTKDIIALVPPRQSGVLQSAVNLRLLDRAARRDDKKLVIVSSDAALAALAASASIPVAKNLQSKPEIAEIAAIDVDDGEEVIDGESLPVGEHASSVGVSGGHAAIDAAVDAVSIEEAESTHAAVKKQSKKAKKGQKVPNFSAFRKRLLLIGGALALLIAFFVWAIVFAPHATIAIKARTTDAPLNQQVSIAPGNELSAENMKLQASEKSGSVDVNSEFTATGEKNVGDKAKGVVQLTRSQPGDVTVAAGTTLSTSSGLEFVTDSAVTVPGATVDFVPPYLHPGSATVGVTAAEGGEKYNGASGSVSGAPSGISAAFSGTTSGGTDKIAAVVTKDDIAKALDAAKSDFDQDKAKQDLKAQFGDSVIAIGDSFTVDTTKLKSSIAADGVADSKTPAIVGSITYTMYGVAKDELKSYLTSALEAQFENPDRQKVYDSGVDSAEFSNIHAAKDSITATLTATGKIGPKIDENTVKDAAEGKKQGEVEGLLKQINGVDTVKVHFSPFWVNVVPSNPQKITVQFDVNG